MSPRFAPSLNPDRTRTWTPLELVPAPADARGGCRPSFQVPRAGDGNRTHVACLEGRYSTIELHPPDCGQARLATASGRSIRSQGHAAGGAGSRGGPVRTDSTRSQPTSNPFGIRGDGSVPRPSD